jgi:hypothetical protein
MAKGYHSKSPEEFKEYIRNLNKSNKKKNWKQLIIFLDIILLMLIFYFVYQNVNPGIMNIASTSNSVQWKSLKLSLSASQIHSPSQAMLYLLVQNSTNDSIIFPDKNIQFSYSWKTEKSEICNSSNYDYKMESRTIFPNTSTAIEIPIPAPQPHPSIQECNKEYLTKKSRFGFGSLKSKVLTLTIKIRNDKEEFVELSLPNNPFR